MFLAIELAQLMLAETTPDDLNWGLLANSAAITSDNLFSDSNPDALAEFSSIDDEDLFSADDLIGVDIDNNGADPACVSFSSELLSDPNELQIRSPGQCVNPLENQDSDTITAPGSNDRKSSGALFPKFYSTIFKTPIYGAKFDPRLCPFERYGPRPYPLCDSGFHRDVIEDDVYWIIDLRNAWMCMYTLISVSMGLSGARVSLSSRKDRRIGPLFAFSLLLICAFTRSRFPRVGQGSRKADRNTFGSTRAVKTHS